MARHVAVWICVACEQERGELVIYRRTRGSCPRCDSTKTRAAR